MSMQKDLSDVNQQYNAGIIKVGTMVDMKAIYNDGQKEHSHCMRCGRKLRSEHAKLLGYGPICQKKMKTVRLLF